MLRNDGLVVGSAVVMPLLETNPPRRGGPPRPPAQENVTVGFLAVMPHCSKRAFPLARWMHPVRAEVAGFYASSDYFSFRLRLTHNRYLLLSVLM